MKAEQSSRTIRHKIAWSIAAILSVAGTAGVACAGERGTTVPELKWTRQFGTAHTDQSFAMAMDGDKAIYISGSTTSDQNGNLLPAPDAFVSKLDLKGRLIWTRRIGAAESDEYSFGVAVDRRGDVYVSGYGGIVPEGEEEEDADVDNFLRKYDSRGRLLWSRQFGTPGSDTPYYPVVDREGNVYVSGRVKGALPGQVWVGDFDAFVQKWSPNGRVLWTRQFGTPEIDTGFGVGVDHAGNVYVGGYTGGSLGAASAGGLDTFLRKYSSNGKELWTRQFGTSGADAGTWLSVGPKGDVYLTGLGNGQLPGEPAPPDFDTFLLKYDTKGNLLWNRMFGGQGPGLDRSQHIVAKHDGVYLMGITASGLPGQPYAGSGDTYVRKYDSKGNVVWTYQLGTAAKDDGRAIAIDDDSVYLTGFTPGTFPGQTAAGGTDVFVSLLKQPDDHHRRGHGKKYGW